MLTAYAVWDNLARAFEGPLWLQRHDAAAVRFFTDLLTDQRSSMQKHPDNYDLYAVATLDESGLEPTAILHGDQAVAIPDSHDYRTRARLVTSGRVIQAALTNTPRAD